MSAIRFDRAEGTSTALSPSRDPDARGLSSSPILETSGEGTFLPIPSIGPSCFPSEKLTDRRWPSLFAGVWTLLRLGSFKADIGVALVLFIADRGAGVGAVLTAGRGGFGVARGDLNIQD